MNISSLWGSSSNEAVSQKEMPAVADSKESEKTQAVAKKATGNWGFFGFGGGEYCQTSEEVNASIGSGCDEGSRKCGKVGCKTIHTDRKSGNSTASSSSAPSPKPPSASSTGASSSGVDGLDF